MKKIISLCLGAALAFSCLSVPVSAAPEEGISGSCGENVTWTLRTGVRDLNIYGYGADDHVMENYTSPDASPWSSLKEYISTFSGSTKNIGNYALAECENLETATLSHVETIGEFSFYNCNQLTDINIPGSVTSIGKYAFADCQSLQNVQPPMATSFIGEGAFSGTALENFTIPKNVTVIEKDTFKNCASLQKIVIPNSVTTISKGAFDGCTSLKEIDFMGTEAEWDKIAVQADLNNADVIFNYSGTVVSGKCGELDWSIDADGNFEITGTGRMPSSTSVGFYAWEDYSSEIMTVTIGEGITSIGHFAFGGCENLTTVTLPTTLEDVGMDIFSGCSALENITVAEGNPRYISKNGCLINTQTKTLVAGTKNASIPIDEAIETIGDYAFIWVDFSFEDLVLPNTVTEIGDYAFCSSSVLKNVTIPASVTSIGFNPFSDCNALEKITVSEQNPNYTGKNCIIDIKNKELITACKNTVIPADGSVTAISFDAFGSCKNMTSVAIPKAIIDIYDQAFSNCDSLTDVYYEGTQQEWNAIQIFVGNTPLHEANIHFNSTMPGGSTGGGSTGGGSTGGGSTGGGSTGGGSTGGGSTGGGSTGGGSTGSSSTDNQKPQDNGGNSAKGWVKEGNTWYYYEGVGVKKTGWLKDGNTWYYLRSNGAMQTGWLKDGNTWYYLKSSGAMQTGWLKDGNAWYYLKSNGAMQTGWLKDGNTWYYLKSSGAMQTGWLKDGNVWYYLKASGAMATGWYWVGNTCYYFYDSGKMASNTTVGGYKVNASGAWVS